MSKAVITVRAAPTYIKLDYLDDTSIRGSNGKISYLMFTDNLTVLDSDGNVKHEFFHFDEEYKTFQIPAFCLEELENRAKQAGIELVKVTIPVSMGAEVSASMIPGFKPKSDIQAGAIAHVTNEANGPNRPVALQAGQGKTVTAMAAVTTIGRRMLVNMASNLDQWVEAVTEWTDIKPDEIYIIKGIATFRKIIEDVDEINPKIIVASTKTLTSFMDFCNKHGSMLEHNGFPKFDNLLHHLGIGIRVIDEYHWNIESNVTLDLRWACAVTIPMTATFLNSDPQTLKILNAHYPPKSRFGYGKYKKYVDIRAIRFSLGERVKRHRFMGAKGYSHASLEDYIIKKKLHQYTHMAIIPCIDKLFLSRRKPIHKMLILCSTTELVDKLKLEIDRHYTSIGKPLSVGVIYAGVDVEQVKEENDILIGTLKKAGTGFDVKNLLVCLNTTCVKSPTENEQNLGRLRELLGQSIVPIYAWLVWDDVSTQCDYFLSRVKQLQPLAKVFGIFRLNRRL